MPFIIRKKKKKSRKPQWSEWSLPDQLRRRSDVNWKRAGGEESKKFASLLWKIKIKLKCKKKEEKPIQNTSINL